jgi:hypothetical protein
LAMTQATVAAAVACSNRQTSSAVSGDLLARPLRTRLLMAVRTRIIVASSRLAAPESGRIATTIHLLAKEARCTPAGW